MKTPTAENASIATGALAALGASTCCFLPLVLVSVGLGGAWIAQLSELERFYPLFAGIAIAAFAFAFYRLYLRRAPTTPEAACASPPLRRRQRVVFWASLVGAKALIASPYVYGALVG